MVRRSLISLMLVLAVIAVFGVTVASVSAQNAGVLCTEVGRVTSNQILVDTEGSVRNNGDSINCSVLAVNREGRGQFNDFRSTGQSFNNGYWPVLDSVDVYVLQPGGARPVFGFFADNEPVRVCFGEFEDARSLIFDPINTADNFLYLTFRDARYVRDAATTGPIREIQVLEVVDAGLDLGYICGDIDTPGTVSLVENLPVYDVTDPRHPYFALPEASRCQFAGQANCR